MSFLGFRFGLPFFHLKLCFFSPLFRDFLLDENFPETIRKFSFLFLLQEGIWCLWTMGFKGFLGKPWSHVDAFQQWVSWGPVLPHSCFLMLGVRLCLQRTLLSSVHSVLRLLATFFLALVLRVRVPFLWDTLRVWPFIWPLRRFIRHLEVWSSTSVLMCFVVGLLWNFNWRVICALEKWI